MQQVINAFKFYTTRTFEQVLIGDLFDVSVFAIIRSIQSAP